MAHGIDGVKVFIGEGLTTRIKVRGHDFLADEPESLGGADTGPSPTEMFLASLGACTAMTLRMYAGRKDWPLETVEVELSHAMIKRSDTPDWPEGEEDRNSLPRITRKIRVRGDLTAEQIERLAYIANRCPVHRTITENPVVVDDLQRAR